MQTCSHEDCDVDLGYDAGMEDPPEKGDGALIAEFNPTDKGSFVVGEQRVFCSLDCLMSDDRTAEQLLEVAPDA